MTWHAGTDTLARYRTGDLGPGRSSSVEAHLVACGECRRDLAVLVDRHDRERIDRLWTGIVDAADSPRAGLAERMLRAIGVREHVARLVAATPSLRASWLLGIGGVLLVTVLTARASAGDRGTLLFLVLAPLLPLASVAAAFSRHVDPTGELGTAAPLHGFHLLLLRAASVLVTTLVMVGAASLAVPATDWRVAAWLLPALAVTITTLLAATWFPVVTSAAAVGLAWVTLAVGGLGGRALRLDTGEAMVERAVAFRPLGQLALALCTLASAWALARRRDSFDYGGLT